MPKKFIGRGKGYGMPVTRGTVRSAVRTGIAVGRAVGSAIKVGRTLYTKLSTRYRNRKFTKTGQKKRLGDAMVRQKPYVAAGGQGTFSKFSSVRRPTPQVKTMKRVGAPNIYLTNTSEQMLVTEGFQDANTKSIQSKLDLISMWNNVVGNTVTPPQVPAQKRFILESTHCEHMITNSSLATAYVDIYDIVRRKDATSSIYTQDPKEAWLQGTVNQQNPANSTSPLNVINSVPTDSQLFRDWFKVVKRTHVSLGTGATHKHSVYLKPNLLMDGSRIAYAGDEAGVSFYTLIVAYGQPASGAGDQHALVTTAKLSIDVVRAIRYKYTFVQNADEILTYSDGLYSLANEQIANAGSGTITANAVA